MSLNVVKEGREGKEREGEAKTIEAMRLWGRKRTSAAAIVVSSAFVSYAGATSTISADTM